MPKPSLLAGAAEVDITPPMGVEMCGYGPYEKRVCTEVLDPLYARALWLQAGDDRLVIIAVDLCTIDIAIRDQVARDLHQRCGIGEECVMVAASHTHSGPAAQLMIGWGERDPGYVAKLPGLLVDAALKAQAALEPARLGCCRRRVTGVGVNREQEDLGPIDTAAQLMRVDRADGTALAAVVNFGAHPVVRYRYTSRISADFPGLLAAYIKVALPCAVPLFLQGPCGNVNAHDMRWWWERNDVGTRQKLCDMRTGDVAKRLGDQVLPALREMETKAEARLSAAWRMLNIPCTAVDAHELESIIAQHRAAADRTTLSQLRPLHERMEDETELEEAWRDARFQVDAASYQLRLLASPPYQAEAPIQVMTIGDAAVVGWPAEVFVELGLELRQRSPVPLTFVVSSANHTVGYVPTPAAYESIGRPNQYGLYGVTRTPKIYGTLPFRADAGTMLIEETLDMLGGVRG